MSSEESGLEDEEPVIILHPLPWRSNYCTKMFDKIDAYVLKRTSDQAKRQMSATKY